MTTSFFRDLASFSSVEGFADKTNYHPAPKNWWVIVTDIVGSTQAIEAGRYRDVNTVGAMGIAALQAALPGLMFPFAFGGDGATALIPAEAKEPAEAALAGLSRLAKNNFQLDLRVGLIPVATLVSENRPIEVAKFKLDRGYPLAVFRGPGIRYAEELLKAGRVTDPPSAPATAADLSGLMCLWKPLRSRRGDILTLLVDTHLETERGAETLRVVLAELQSIFSGQLEIAAPIHIDAMEFQTLPTLIRRERRFQTTWLPYLQRVLVAIVMWVLCGTGFHRRIPSLKNYFAEFHADSDYRKLYHTLSLVLDCTTNEIQAIEALLERLHAEGQIDYGMHRSNDCLMTCFVPSPAQGEHVAFVDGGNGGYAVAAKAMKKRKATRRHNEVMAYS